MLKLTEFFYSFISPGFILRVVLYQDIHGAGLFSYSIDRILMNFVLLNDLKLVMLFDGNKICFKFGAFINPKNSKLSIFMFLKQMVWRLMKSQFKKVLCRKWLSKISVWLWPSISCALGRLIIGCLWSIKERFSIIKGSRNFFLFYNLKLTC